MPYRFGVGGLLMLLTLPQSASAQSIGDVFRGVSDAVVVILTSERTVNIDAPGQLVSVGGLGSGVLISDTEIMTASHVVQTADQLVVVFPSGERLRATVVASEPTADVALLELENRPTRVVPARLGDSDSVQVGDQIFVIGAPFGVSHTLTVGHISARRKPSRTLGSLYRAELLQTDAAINQGNSGGPMFNMKGEVVGIVSHILSKTGAYEGLGFVVTTNLARDLLLSGVAIWSGIEGLDLEGDVAAAFNLSGPGTLVQRVAAGSLGDRLGLRGGTIPATIAGQEAILGGDIIVSALGVPMGGPEQDDLIREAAQRLRPGDLITVTVLRGGRQLELSAPYTPRVGM